MIDVTAFEAEITDPVDVFIGPSRPYNGHPGDGHPYLYVVLPSFSFKVRLAEGNLDLLRLGLDEWAGRESQ